MAAGMGLSFFMNGAFAGVYAYTPEIFPTSVRTTGVGSSSSFGRIGSVSAPILVGFVYPTLGFVGVFGMTTAVAVSPTTPYGSFASAAEGMRIVQVFGKINF